MKIKVSILGMVLAAGSAGIIASGTVFAADTWPEKPIRLLVGFAPGGPTDNVARILAKQMSTDLGQPIIVENKAGAGGNIAAAALRQMPADGYAFFYNTSSIVIAPWVYKAVGYDPLKDFAPVGLTAGVPLVLVASNSVPANSAEELIALIKANPGNYNYASSGTGAIEHLTAAQLLSTMEGNAVHVPYKGTAPAQVDLIAGATQFTTTTLNTAIGPVKAGTLKALAITSKLRSPVMKDVPTVDESLIPGFESIAWQGIVAPVGTPAAIIEKLNQAINKALESPEVKSSLGQQGTFSLGGSSQEYSDYIQNEYVRWEKVVKDSGSAAK